MIIDYANRKISFESPAEKIDYDKHMAEFGPGVNPPTPHPENCPYCAERGWEQWLNTTFEEECDKWAAEHPEVEITKR